MSTSETKEELHKLIDESDENIIKAMYAMLKAYNEDLDLDEYNRDIDEAMQEIEQGIFTTHDQALKQLNK